MKPSEMGYRGAASWKLDKEHTAPVSHQLCGPLKGRLLTQTTAITENTVTQCIAFLYITLLTPVDITVF